LITSKELRQFLSSEIMADVPRINKLNEWPPLKKKIVEIELLIADSQ